LRELNSVFGAYLVINTLNLLHARRRPHSAPRYRFALLVDVAMVSVASSTIPTSFRLPWWRTSWWCWATACAMAFVFSRRHWCPPAGRGHALVLRYWRLHMPVSQGAMFLTLFGAIIVVYAYILMGRIERSRQRSELRSRTDRSPACSTGMAWPMRWPSGWPTSTGRCAAGGGVRGSR